MRPVDLLTAWVKLKFDGNKIKRSGQPYFNHLTVVAELAAPLVSMGYEIGICHDLLEDTSVTENEFLKALNSFGYNDLDAVYISGTVIELTDVFTSDAYPKLSKMRRKEKEVERLAGISSVAQTVKYCDLMDNIKWVMQYDLKHASKYLLKKRMLLSAMCKGDGEMRQKVINEINEQVNKLAN